MVSLDLSRFSRYSSPRDQQESHQELLGKLSQNMTSLRQLHLGGLNLSSKVPDSLANLSSLTHLSLYGCSLLGEFPIKIFQFPNIQFLDLSYNDDLTVSLPEFHSGSNLVSLQLPGTKFMGKLPNSIGNLKSLNVLDLFSCEFSGSVPYSLGNLSHISYLDLSWNHFNGQLPSTLGNLTKIRKLQLQNNDFSGEFPSSLNLPQLEVLYLHGNNFSGQLPSLIGNLTSLTYLDISNNFFHGRFPKSLPYHLVYFSLHNNSLTGPIPSRTFNNLTCLHFIDLSWNSLNGVIPSTLLSLPSSYSLELQYNQFVGLESVISNSSQLYDLNLQANEINGYFPSSIFKLRELNYLNLGSNNLSGSVDFGKFSELNVLETLDLSYNSLSLTNLSMNSAVPKFRDLYLSSCNISEFPDFLKMQSELVRLDLSYNMIFGPIPKWFMSVAIKSLDYLRLSHNFITGWEEVPSVLPWENMDYLDLRSNMLQGPLVVPPMSTWYFFVSNNNLTGGINRLFCKLSHLRMLDVSNNSLGGTIPQCLANLDGNLTALNLRRNYFQGNIPGFCKGESQLQTLDLSHNHLHGNIPRSLSKCKDLHILNLGNNQIRDTFPFWLQNLQSLQVLVLRFNKFYGPIWRAHNFVGFATLKIIDLSHNRFGGNIPSEYFRNWTSMSAKVYKNANETKKVIYAYVKGFYNDSVSIITKGQVMELVRTLTIFISLDLSNNKFDGEVPTTIWDLRSLVMLNLSSNNFSGVIPSSIGNLIELQSLDLSSNRLSGKIPQQLVALTFLEYLNLSHNRLVGPIPQGGQMLTFENSSFEGNLGLCGLPLSKKCETPIPASNDHYDENSDFISGFGWKAVVVGYGCGLLIGLVVGHVILSRRPDLIFKVFGVTAEGQLKSIGE